MINWNLGKSIADGAYPWVEAWIDQCFYDPVMEEITLNPLPITITTAIIYLNSKNKCY